VPDIPASIRPCPIHLSGFGSLPETYCHIQSTPLLSYRQIWSPWLIPDEAQAEQPKKMPPKPPTKGVVSKSGVLKGMAPCLKTKHVAEILRTHRERKDFYMKNLEAEVVTLREKDVAHDHIVIGLKRKIIDLNRILTANGIPIPPGLVHIESPQASIAVQMQADGVPNVRATMPTLTTTHSQSWSQSDTMPSTTVSNTDVSDLACTYDQMKFGSGSQVPSLPTQRDTTAQRRGHQHDLDAAQIAVDFVLDLERPCLSHHGPEVHNGEFSGHKLMVQTPIMAHSNTPRPVFNLKPGGQIPASASWTVPAVEVERLLNLSSRLSLEGEITPIEAWQKIKQHPGFASLDRDGLEQLKTILLPEVQCLG
jgi:hypothetical protein